MPESSKHNDTTDLSSMESGHDNAYATYVVDSTHEASRARSHGSELSLIISGIRDDHDLDAGYIETADADYGLVRRLTRNEQSRRGSISNPSLCGDHHNCADNNAGGTSTKGGVCTECKVEGADSEDSNDDSYSEDNDPPKDKGYAWVVAFSSMCAVFSTWGASAGYGVFLSYYMASNSFPGATEYDYALIGGLIVFFAQLLAPVCVLSYKIFGPYWTSYFGIALQTAGYLLASFATEIWQLYCTQGVIVGVSFSFVFLPGTLMLPTWFEKRKATAMGISVSGAGLGGVFFSLVVQKLIDVTGDQRWALRMCAFVTGIVALVACSLMRPRCYKKVPLKQTLTKEFISSNAKAAFSLAVFKDYALVLLGVWFGLVLLGYVLVIYTVSSYGISRGLSASQGSVLTAVLNAAQVIGRPTCGHIADRVGRFNHTIVNCLVVAIFVLAMWINSSTFGPLVVFSVLTGFTIGVGSLFCQPLASDILNDAEKLPAAWSGLNIIVSFFCIASEVMALALKKNGAVNPYLHSQIFGGLCFFVGALLLMVIREKVVRKKLIERLAATREQLGRTTRSGYLKKEEANVDEKDEEETRLAEARIARYEIMLNPRHIQYFFIRMFYPIKC